MSFIDKAKEQDSLGDDVAIDQATASGLAEAFFSAGEFALDEECVAGHDGFAEFDFIGTHEVADFPLILRAAHHDNAGDLSHGFELKNAWHDGMVGKVSLEIRFVDGDSFHAGGFQFAIEFHNAIHHEERIAVRENLHDRIDVEGARRGGNGFGCGWRDGVEALGEKFGGLGIDAVAGFYCNNVAPDETT